MAFLIGIVLLISMFVSFVRVVLNYFSFNCSETRQGFRIQAGLLNTMASFGVSDVKQFTFVPQVAMKVNATGLLDLLSNPDVTGIWEDMPLAPAR